MDYCVHEDQTCHHNNKYIKSPLSFNWDKWFRWFHKVSSINYNLIIVQISTLTSTCMCGFLLCQLPWTYISLSCNTNLPNVFKLHTPDIWLTHSNEHVYQFSKAPTIKECITFWSPDRKTTHLKTRLFQLTERLTRLSRM